MTRLLIVVGILVAVAFWWFVLRNRPKLLPLEIDDDDPRMLAAMTRARATLADFQALMANGSHEAQVKIPFESNTGVTEHLWAEVVALNESSVSVRYLTPPVTHTGKLGRLHERPLTDIEDWVVFFGTGEIHGAFTQRVMFEVAREKYGVLPRELKKQEARFVD